MCSTLSGLRQSSVVKLMSYLRIKADQTLIDRSSFFLIPVLSPSWAVLCLGLQKNTARKPWLQHTPKGLLIDEVSFKLFTVCVWGENDCTVHACICPCAFIYVQYVCMRVFVLVKEDERCVCWALLSAPAMFYILLRVDCSAQWLELSTLMWWHGLKPQQETKGGQKKDSERRFEGQAEITAKVWDGGLKKERVDLDNSCNSSL